MNLFPQPIRTPELMCSRKVIEALADFWDEGLATPDELLGLIEQARTRPLGQTLHEILPADLAAEFADQLAALDTASPIIQEEVLGAAEAAARAGMPLRFTFLHPSDANVGVQVTTWHQLGGLGHDVEVGPFKEISLHVGEAFTG